MRLFIAIDLPLEHRESMSAAVTSLNIPSAKVVAPPNIHLTLRFLGDVSEDAVDGLVEAATKASVKHSPFEIQYGPIGGFPNLRRPKVVWAGLSHGHEQVLALKDSIEEAVISLGWEPDDRFHPHVTLARVKHPNMVGPRFDIASATKGLERNWAANVPVGGFSIVRSVIDSRGATHHSLCSLSFS